VDHLALAEAIFLDQEELRSSPERLYVRRSFKLRILRELSGDDRSALCTAQLLTTSVYLRYVTSSDPTLIKHAATWSSSTSPQRIVPVHTQSLRDRDGINSYRWDATVQDDDGRMTWIRCPWFQRHRFSVETIRDFLSQMENRHRGEVYHLCAPLGFRVYRKQKGKFPWE
jgi:hypothetical protein